MPNRMLRDWTKSYKMAKLSAEAERFFTRLIMKADDYGSYHADPMLLRAALFPVLDVTTNAIASWLDECHASKLIFFYDGSDEKKYLRIIDFNQRLRQMRNKFPDPVAGESLTSGWQLTATGGKNTNKKTKKKKKTKTKTKGVLHTPTRARATPTDGEKKTNEKNLSENVLLWPTFLDFWELYGKNVDRAKCEKLWEKIDQGAREKIMQVLPEYIAATPDVRYRRDPARFLTNKSWENEIIQQRTNGPNTGRITKEGTLRRLASYRDK